MCIFLDILLCYVFLLTFILFFDSWSNILGMREAVLLCCQCLELANMAAQFIIDFAEFVS